MTLKGGGSDPIDFAGSMAEAIEVELNHLLTYDGKDALPADDSDAARDRRRFLAAIARGMLAHLKAHPEALQVDFTQVASPHTTGQFKAVVQIDADMSP
jgi:hypothetical protein